MKVDKTLKTSPHTRKHIGTIYFPQGTTANEVCVKVQKREKKEFGLWLFQQKIKDSNAQSRGIDDSDYVTIKDSKHVLQDNTQYIVIHYSGMAIELAM